ncbi:MAG: hypothetical protein EKK31_18590 [Hyphomicrobiales bacterium]|nr:MAG: hypothetical protein EKK31_18590 [Hyphomicrobiales bacterium]
MKALFMTILIMVLSPIAMVILSGLYFGIALWLTGGPGQVGAAMGEIVGRISFIVGLPAGAVVGIAVLAKTEKKQKSRVLEWISFVVGFGLAAILFFPPLYFGFGQLGEMLLGRRFGIYIAMGFVVLVGWIIKQIDNSSGF